MISVIISSGVLWFLISYFTRGTEGGSRKAFTIIMIVTVCNFLMAYTLQPIIGSYTVLISIAVLYFSIDLICDTSRRNTLWITGCYFVIMILIGLFYALLAVPVEA